MIVTITGWSRNAYAVAWGATRATAPPRTRAWTIAIGEVRRAMKSSIASTAASSRAGRNSERWTLAIRPSGPPSSKIAG